MRVNYEEGNQKNEKYNWILQKSYCKFYQKQKNRCQFSLRLGKKLGYRHESLRTRFSERWDPINANTDSSSFYDLSSLKFLNYLFQYYYLANFFLRFNHSLLKLISLTDIIFFIFYNMSSIHNSCFYSLYPHAQEYPEPNLNLEQSSEYFLEVHQHDTTQLKCRKFAQINENLTYNISLLEVELEVLKKCQHEKIVENNKMKEKLKQKFDKEQDMKKHLKAQSVKIKKLVNGFKLLSLETEDFAKKEQEMRENRLNAQQIKNQKYQSYNNLEKEYRELILKIKVRDGLDQAFQNQLTKNEQLLNQIDEIQGCLNEEKSFRENADVLRKQRGNKIKQLNEKVLALEKEQTNLKNQINQIERNQMIWQSQRQKIEEKSAEAIKIYQRIQQSKSTLVAKKLEYSELDSTYKQICIQENRLKKQIFLQKQCEQERKRYKQTLKKKPLQNTSREENNQSPVLPTKTMENLESGGSSYHNLLKRYENMSRKK